MNSYNHAHNHVLQSSTWWYNSHPHKRKSLSLPPWQCNLIIHINSAPMIVHMSVYFDQTHSSNTYVHYIHSFQPQAKTNTYGFVQIWSNNTQIPIFKKADSNCHHKGWSSQYFPLCSWHAHFPIYSHFPIFLVLFLGVLWFPPIFLRLMVQPNSVKLNSWVAPSHHVLHKTLHVLALDVLHVISHDCALAIWVCVGDSSRRSEEIVKIANCSFKCDQYHYYHYISDGLVCSFYIWRRPQIILTIFITFKLYNPISITHTLSHMQRERERESKTHTHTHTHTERKRQGNTERERRERSNPLPWQARAPQTDKIETKIGCSFTCKLMTGSWHITLSITNECSPLFSEVNVKMSTLQLSRKCLVQRVWS